MEGQPVEKPKSNIGLVIAIVLVVLCCCVLILAAVGVVAYEYFQQIPSLPGVPDVPFGPPTPTPLVEVTRPPVAEVPTDTLETLKTTIVPENNPIELACRLKGVCDIPETMPPPAGPRQVGEQDTFWVTNVESNENFEVQATLHYVTPHVYFWVQDGVDFDEGAVVAP
jgi:hypothetical protein